MSCSYVHFFGSHSDVAVDHIFLQVGNAAFTATTVSVPDFTSVGNLAFPPNGSTDSVIPTPPHDLAHTFKFKSYAPKIFHRLREFYDISASAYMDSVCG